MSSISNSYPYKDHPEPYLWNESEKEVVETFYKWIQEQPHLKRFSKNHAHLFLHSCYWKLETAKKIIQRFTELRNSAPLIFLNRDPLLPELQNAFNIIQAVSLPEKTKEGHTIIIYRLQDSDASKFVHQNVFKCLMMFTDVQVSRNGPVDGYVIILDMKGLKLSHFPRVQLSIVRLSSSYFQEAHPYRLKKIVFVNSSSLVSQLMVLARPFINPNLMNLLKFTTGGPEDHVPLELLPEDYGGPLASVEKLYNETRNRIETEYRDWLREFTCDNPESEKFEFD